MAEVEVAADTAVITDAPDLATSLGESLAELELREEEDGESGETKEAADWQGERVRRPRYPVRPGEAECVFYMRTGSCKFGANCKFNHPPDRRGQGKKNENGKTSEADKNDIPEQAELSESKETKIVKEKTNEMDQNDSSDPTEPAECKYYLTTGGCKFGKSCKFSHLKAKTKTEDRVELNFLGLPIRLGEKECQFYMKTGSCKFASNCKFHHPDPTAVGDLNQNGATHSVRPHVAQWNMQMATNRSLSPYLGQHPPYAPYIYSHHPGTPMNSEWNGYSVPVPDWNMAPQPSVPSFNVRGVGKKDDVSTAQPQQRSVEEFPERPGETECQHYMKTGNCKFRSACRYHHPKNRSQKPTCVLSPAGLPLRPGQPVCAHFSRYGVCKFGPACRFDHSMIESSSTVPLTSTPSAQQSDEPLNSSEPVEPACEDNPKEPVETSA